MDDLTTVTARVNPDCSGSDGGPAAVSGGLALVAGDVKVMIAVCNNCCMHQNSSVVEVGQRTKAQPRPEPTADVDDFVTAVLTASRVLVGVSARSLAQVEETVTVTQFRTLVVLDSHGDINLNQLASLLDVTASTAMRMIERSTSFALENLEPRQLLSVPTSPSNLAVANATTSALTLTWHDNSNNETGFQIQRLINGNWATIINLGPSNQSYTDSGLAAGTAYAYRIQAFNADGNSLYYAFIGNAVTLSNPVTPPPPTIPAAPTALTTSAPSSSQITLNWTDNTNNETGFNIVLSAEVPDLVTNELRGTVEGFLADNDLSMGQICSFIFHSGGPKVLRAMEASLDLPPGALAASWNSLRQRGNLSSASVLTVMEDFLMNRPGSPGCYSMIGAMGPAFCSELLLLQW